MKRETFGTVVIDAKGKRVVEVGTNADITHLFRDVMIDHAESNL
jgi:hypothetical protein